MGVKTQTYKLYVKNDYYIIKKRLFLCLWVTIAKSKCKLKVLRKLRQLTHKK